jgi:hypothetical protein
MKLTISNFVSNIIKGIVLGYLYLEITKANDTTFDNVVTFAMFYIVMLYSTSLVGLDSNIVTHAFITKTIFTIVDERVKKNSDNPTKN